MRRYVEYRTQSSHVIAYSDARLRNLHLPIPCRSVRSVRTPLGLPL